MKMIGYKGFEVAQTLLYLFIFAVLGVEPRAFPY
jgi:hypothetical protein